MSSHLAAVTVAKAQPFEIQSIATPKPGRNELLIAVKSVALNPADWIIRDTGLLISTYPSFTGFDLAGLVIEAGKDVPTDAFKPGSTRVAAYAAGFWRGWSSGYGAFQEQMLVPWQHAVPLPDNISWNDAATLPVSMQVPLNAWDAMGIPRSRGTTTSVVGKKQALLIWGASSSVGTGGVQTARIICSDPKSSLAAVYATAGASNLDYVASLGANRVFDYKDPNIVQSIVSAAKEDGLVIRHCFLGMGQLSQCQAVLKEFGGTASSPTKIASAPPVSEDAETSSGVEVIFLQPSTVEEERITQFHYWLGTFVKEHLASGAITPSPKPTVVGKGLESISVGLDKLKQGVSCTKLVVEIAE